MSNMVKLNTFDRKKEWWLWMCLNAPLTHVCGLSANMEDMQNIINARNAEIEVLSESQAQRDKLLEENGELTRKLQAVNEVAFRARKGDLSALNKRMDIIQKILQGDDPEPTGGEPIVVDPEKVDLEDLTVERDQLIKPKPPWPEEFRPHVTEAIPGGLQVTTTKERWDELIEAESNNEYWERTLNASQEEARKDVQRHEAEIAPLNKKMVEAIEATGAIAEERQEAIHERDNYREMLTIAMAALVEIQNLLPLDTKGHVCASACLTVLHHRQSRIDEHK